MGINLKAVGGGDRIVNGKLHDNADTASGMDIGGHCTLVAGEAADLDVLADGENLVLQKGVNGHVAAVSFGGKQGLNVGGVFVNNGVGAGLDKGLELGNEVGLGVDLDSYGNLAALADLCKGHTLGGNAPGLLHGSGKALLAQKVNSLLHVAFGLGQGFFAVHHAAAGLLTEFGYVFSGKIHGKTSFLFICVYNYFFFILCIVFCFGFDFFSVFVDCFEFE